MKLVTFENNGVDRVGAVSADGRSIVDLEAAAEMTGIDGSFGSMIEFLEAGAAGLRTAGSLLDSPDSRNLLRLDAARLRAPVPCPRKLFALAGNYVEHITEAGRAVEPQDKQTPRVFMKPPFSTVIGPGADIDETAGAGRTDLRRRIELQGFGGAGYGGPCGGSGRVVGTGNKQSYPNDQHRGQRQKGFRHTHPLP